MKRENKVIFAGTMNSGMQKCPVLCFLVGGGTGSRIQLPEFKSGSSTYWLCDFQTSSIKMEMTYLLVNEM